MDILAARASRKFIHNHALCRRCLYHLACRPRSHALPTFVNRAPGRRHAHTGSQPRKQDEEENTPGKGESRPSQAYPLKGFYAELMNTPPTPSKRTRSPAPPQEPQPEPAEQTPEEKMKIVFGSRLASPGYQSTRYNPATTSPESTWHTINGVPIPPRPLEPDNCCMSGCAHCVWDDYREDLESWAHRIEEARARAPEFGGGQDMRQKPRAEVDSASISMDDDGGGSETNWGTGLATTGDDLFGGIPVGIREFMKTEKRLRQKHLEEEGKV